VREKRVEEKLGRENGPGKQSQFAGWNDTKLSSCYITSNPRVTFPPILEFYK